MCDFFLKSLRYICNSISGFQYFFYVRKWNKLKKYEGKYIYETHGKYGKHIFVFGNRREYVQQ